MGTKIVFITNENFRPGTGYQVLGRFQYEWDHDDEHDRDLYPAALLPFHNSSGNGIS
jgi:hypothetical protein